MTGDPNAEGVGESDPPGRSDPDMTASGGPSEGREQLPGDPVNGFDILAKVTELPISTWRYAWESNNVRHLGPMAQDWLAVFGPDVAEDMFPLTIPTMDMHGVALVAIQALNRLVGELRTEIDELRAQLPDPQRE